MRRRTLWSLVILVLQPVGSANKVIEVIQPLASLIVAIALVAALVGWAIGLVQGFFSGFFGGLALCLLISLGLMFWAAYRLQRRVLQLEAPPPSNRDNLIVAIMDYERAARDLVLDRWAYARVTVEHPDRVVVRDHRVIDAYDEAEYRLKKEIAIAGPRFRGDKHHRFRMSELNLALWRHSEDDDITDEKRDLAIDTLREGVEAVRRAIDPLDDDRL